MPLERSKQTIEPNSKVWSKIRRRAILQRGRPRSEWRANDARTSRCTTVEPTGSAPSLRPRNGRRHGAGRRAQRPRNGGLCGPQRPTPGAAAAPTRSAAPRRRAASTCSASLRAQLPRRGPRAAAGQRATPAGPSTCLPPPATLAALLWARQQRRAHGRLRAAVKRSTSTPIKELTGAHLPSRSHPTPAPRVTRPDARRRRRGDRVQRRAGLRRLRNGGPPPRAAPVFFAPFHGRAARSHEHLDHNGRGVTRAHHHLRCHHHGFVR